MENKVTFRDTFVKILYVKNFRNTWAAGVNFHIYERALVDTAAHFW
jgi:phosphoribulokinase